jgi:hypothetical protein
MDDERSDRIRVARVTLELGDRTEEIAECWVAVSPKQNRVGIWLDPADDDPAMLVPLANTTIEWSDRAPMNGR